MIVGIGADIVATARIRALLERHGEGFSTRILAEAERAEFASVNDPARFLAKRFAAKEAFAKAFGTGVRVPATLHAISVTHDELGKPAYQFNAVLEAEMQRRGWRSHLSISDEKEMVVAFALIETN